jgi:predicted N-acetyltransferase YhbS
LLENDLDSHADFSPWLANFFVLPEYRNRRIGRALYEALIKEAFENLQYEACYLYTENHSPYESKKWITIGQFQYRNKLQYFLKLTDNVLS